MKTIDEFARINRIEGHVFISFDLDVLTKYDEIACGSLKLEVPEFIMPALFDYSTTVTTVRYSVPDDYVDIANFDGELQIEDVLTLYENILNTIEQCEDWYLCPGGFCFETKYIFMNKAHNALKFIYVPDQERSLDKQGIKYLMISLLEKCNETSGGNIQLQLYKYFYKPKFDLEELKRMISGYLSSLVKKEMPDKKVITDQVTDPTKEQFKESKNLISKKTDLKKEEVKSDVEEKKSIEKENISPIESLNQEIREIDTLPRTFYTPKINRSQLSQEEIEEMVKSIYSTKTTENVGENNDESEVSVYTQVAESTSDESESFYNANSKDSKKSNTRKKNLFDSMFTPAKSQKATTYSAKASSRVPSLKSISVHTRYDLPKLIEIHLEDDTFVLGRATRTGEPTGAHYEFGAEITPISRLHAKIGQKDGAYYLQDLGSSNGTFLNGNKMEPNKPYLIEDGDKVAFAIAYSKNSIEYVFVE